MPEGKQFRPVSTFSWEINRTERSHQAHWLVPLLDHPEGRVWFLEKLKCTCTSDDARAAGVFHLCFPLRDIFTEDYYRCRGKPDLAKQFIAYYNRLFGLPEDFGVRKVWLTAPGGELRHPAAGGRAGWYENFLRERIPDETRYTDARNVRRMLGTEADVLMLTESHVILVGCKFKGKPSTGQYKRQQMMGKTLASRLGKEFHFGMVVEEARDSRFVRLHIPCVHWSDIQSKLREITGV